MFQSIINQPAVGAGRFGAGMWVSLMVHAGVFASVLGLSGGATQEPPFEGCEISPIRRVVQPAPRESNPQPTPAPTQSPRSRAERKPRRELVQLVKSPLPAPLDEAPGNEASPSEEPPADCVDCAPNTIGSLALGPNEALSGHLDPEAWRENSGAREEVLPFGAGMAPPQLLAGAQLQYTREALEARVSGTVIARCTITREGEVENCRVIRGLPHMDAAVLDALTSRHYRPVSFQGQPVSVSYTFHVRLELP
ncbi:hypothetical protein BO221_00390 [Archangium sp. Cb G35]|uniref:energy transducer TonB n=1 Tax=Archangium sp. Cb G35 TaxID=1920190 RepID=UPI00093746C7|nr:energy transducer TonB [Archangium sp. Cb G35]OJT26540.1 hypothetical protein BO221_00390 [Archangium sp. Cb G35]